MITKHKFLQQLLISSIIVSCLSTIISAATPVVKVEFNISGRQDTEVNEPGWLSWPVVAGASVSREIDGVTFTFTRSGTAGIGLKGDWYKAGIQAPYYARLVCDGLTVEDGASGGVIEMKKLLTETN